MTDVAPEVRQALEAVLMVAEEPVTPGLLAQLLEVPAQTVEAMCDELDADCVTAGRGFRVQRVAGGYRIVSAPEAGTRLVGISNWQALLRR